MRPRQDGRLFPDNIFKSIFFNKNVQILRLQLTIFCHWFRYWLGACQATSHYLNLCWLVYWRIHASPGYNVNKDPPEGEGYFVGYFPPCAATRVIQTQITFEWTHKQFITWLHTLLYFLRNIIRISYRYSRSQKCLINSSETFNWLYYHTTICCVAAADNPPYLLKKKVEVILGHGKMNTTIALYKLNS